MKRALLLLGVIAMAMMSNLSAQEKNAVCEQVRSVVYDFDDHTFQGWTSIDADGDGYNWMDAGSYTWENFVGEGHGATESFLYSESFVNGDQGAVHPDNYLVSPEVSFTEGMIIGIYATDGNDQWGQEHFGVAVSTSGNTDAADFETIAEWTLLIDKERPASKDGRQLIDGIWFYYSADLSQYAGQTGYVAIRHFDCTNMFVLCVDDIFIGVPAPKYNITVSASPDDAGTVSGGGMYEEGTPCTLSATPEAEYDFINWTKDGEVVSTVPEYTFTVTEEAHYIAVFQYDAVDEEEGRTVAVYPNPACTKMTVQAPVLIHQCEVYDVTGALVASKTVGAESFDLQLEDLPSGCYFLRLISDDLVLTKRFMKE